MGPPITYRLDGKQYVALMGGVGQAAPAATPGPGNQPTPFAPKLLTFVLDGDAAVVNQQIAKQECRPSGLSGDGRG